MYNNLIIVQDYCTGNSGIDCLHRLLEVDGCGYPVKRNGFVKAQASQRQL